MTKLTDIQLILLTTASQREDGSLLPPSETIDGQGERIRKSMASLLKKGLAEETEVAAEAQCWRREGERLIGVRVTEAGRTAIGLPSIEGNTDLTAKPDAQPETGGTNLSGPAAPTAARAGSKQAQVIELLKRTSGASLDELVQATGWLPHTTRAALTGLRKRGYSITSQKVDKVTCYRILSSAA